MCTAMLIGGQLALSSISGIEIVTVLMLCFSFSYGIKSGVAIATTFSLLRCFIFGFYINVIVLYLVYYNLFAVYFGWLGKRLRDKSSLFKTVVVALSAIVFTMMFTVLDNILTPLMFGFNRNSMSVYFLASLYAVIPQTISNMIIVSVFFGPLTKVISKINF